MEELSIEERATRYNAALEYAHCLIEQCKEGTEGSFHCADLQKMFPELQESEDERIRKELLSVVNDLVLPDEQRSRFVAWLEKQGEQPKKHDVCDYCDQQGSCVSPCPMKLVEKQGEQILANSCKTCKDEQKPEVDQHSLPVSDDSSLPTFDEDVFHPCIEKKDKPETEEMAYFKKAIADIVDYSRKHADVTPELFVDRFIKHILDIAKLALKPELDKEYERGCKQAIEDAETWLDTLCDYLKDSSSECIPTVKEVISKLKSLKDRVGCKADCTTIKEWGEEDEKILNSIICSINACDAIDGTILVSLEKHEKKINWLKSLRPHSQWRPSDEQMEALEKECIAHSNYELCRLLEQLKKLREK